jgi:hypothetical protein
MLVASGAFALVLAPTAPAAELAVLPPAARSLAQCVQNSGRLSVLMLIDESGSLRTTDPEGRRVDGVRAALTGLSDLAETPVNGSKPEVSVLMAGFYAKVHPDPRTGPVGAGAWNPVNRNTVDELNAAAGDYAELDQGRATDYGTALLGARQLLRERSIEQSTSGSAPACQALIWFTDGRYSLPRRIGKAGLGLPKTVPYAPGVRLDEAGAGERAVAAGRRLMCRPGGVMDDLASSGVTRFTVALSTQLSPEDAAFLDAATTGTGGSRSCGSQLSPRTGEFLGASDSDSLFFVFGDLLSGPVPVNAKVVCPGLSCVRGITAFRTVPGLSQFLIRASSAIEDAELELEAPNGQSVRLTPEGPERVSLAGVSVTSRWVSPTAVEVQGDFDADSSDWVGAWSYVFVDPAATAAQDPAAKSRSAIQLFADLEPAIVGEPTLIRGAPTRLRFVLQRASGEGEPLSAGPLLESAALTATIDDPVAGTSDPVRVTGPDQAGRFSATVTIPEQSSAGFVYLGLTAHLAIPGGTPVAPQYRSYSLPVRFPPGQGFPTISPESLQLPSVVGLSSTEGELTVTGSSVATGCVWLGMPDLDTPDREPVTAVVAPTARSAGECLKLSEGEERTLRIRFQPASAATGDISGSLPVHLRSDVVSGSRTVSVPVTFVVAPEPNVAQRDILFLLLIVFGTLFPVGFLHFLNYLGARFTAPQDLLFLAQDAEVGPAGIRASTEPLYTNFRPLTLSGENRKVRLIDEIDGVEFRTVASGRLSGLFRGPYGLASAEGGGPLAVGGQAGALRSWGAETRHEVPLSLAGTWLFVPAGGPVLDEQQSEPVEAWGTAAGSSLLDRDAGDLKGRLIFLIANGGDLEQGKELWADAARVLAEEEARQSLLVRPEEAEDDEGGDGRSGWFRRRERKETDAVPDEETGAPVGDSVHDDDPWA